MKPPPGNVAIFQVIKLNTPPPYTQKTVLTHKTAHWNYSPSPLDTQHRRKKQSRARSVHFTLDCFFRLCFPVRRDGDYIPLSRSPFHEWKGAGGLVERTVIYMEETQGKRYVAHDFLIGSPVLIDRVENTMSFYKHNIYGQIYNLGNPEHYVIDSRRINGLIRRTNNPDYSFANSKVVDGYIYKYIMTPEQQAMCGRTPHLSVSDELIIATNNKNEAIKTMCEYVYEHTYCKQLGDKNAERGRLLKYCDDFLAGKQQPAPTEKQTLPTADSKNTDRGSR